MRQEVEEKHDAFLLDAGMGPMTYITSNGRVLLDFRTWDGEPLREACDSDEETACIVVGAKKTGIEELLQLLPSCPADASVCPKCSGARWCGLTGDAAPCR